MACILPISIRNPNGAGTVIAPCGKCPQCRHRRVNSWVFRLLQESKIHRISLFVTLTYSPENLPRSARGLGTLFKEDVQNFFKRLRKATRTKSIRYYACGEYGTETMRPHYHLIIFDATPAQIVTAWSKKGIPIGNTWCDSDVNTNNIAYVCKYMCKVGKVPYFSGDDRLPEFSLMSKKMGRNYLTNDIKQYHELSQNSFLTNPSGSIQSMPRYYRDILFTQEEREQMNAKTQALYLDKFEEMLQTIDVGPCADELERKQKRIDKYHRDRFEGVKAAMKHFEQQKNNKREKL